jgi:23S rRNA pseudouridine955/2504/2580 synthase
MVRVNGKRVKNNTVLRIGDKINFTRIIQDEVSLDRKDKYNNKFAEFIKKLVIYKDRFKVILNKPSGLAVQGGTNIKLNIDLMLDSLKFGLDERPKLVHRIDKQTSGLLMVARSLSSSKYYGELFKKRMIEKIYLAVVHGKLRYKMAKINLKVGEKKSLPALTFYKVLAQNDELSFLVIKPVTGRKHQIRDHLNFLGNRIFGETKFKSSNKLEFFPDSKNLHLHAYSLKFQEQDKSIKKIVAPLPDYFVSTINENRFEKNLVNYDLEFVDSDNFKYIKNDKD